MRGILGWVVVLGLAGCDGEMAGSPAAGATAEVLYFSAIPDQNSTELAEKFGRIADYLSRTLDVPVRYRPASDYGASVEMFKSGDIQLAWFGGLTGCQARQAVPGARAIAQGQEDPRFYSYFIAHADTGLERSDEFPAAIADLTFTFGSEKSTSGRLMPEYFIRRRTGKSPREFFAKPFGYSGSHDKTWEAVQSGRVQAGALNYTTYDKRVWEGKIDPEVCKIIWKSPEYADYNFTAHPVLEERYGKGFTDRLQEALVAMSGDLLLAFPRSALIEAANEDFDALAQVARELNLLR
ncbi:MAG: putative selenate ABC transporter substrate-binding protein [Planctomycetota bacterium]|jgi:phosphonate transport system substrate-binding protein